MVEVVQSLELPPTCLDGLKTAIAHGNENHPELPVALEVLVSGRRLCVRITDHGSGRAPIADAQAPAVEAKLAGLEAPRGWEAAVNDGRADARVSTEWPRVR